MNAVANKSIKPNIKTTALHPTKRKNEIQPAGQLFDPAQAGSSPMCHHVIMDSISAQKKRILHKGEKNIHLDYAPIARFNCKAILHIFKSLLEKNIYSISL